MGQLETRAELETIMPNPVRVSAGVRMQGLKGQEDTAPYEKQTNEQTNETPIVFIKDKNCE